MYHLNPFLILFILVNLIYAQDSHIFFIENFESGTTPQTFLSDFYGNLSTDPNWVIQRNTVASGSYSVQHRFTAGGEGTHVTQHFGDATKNPKHEQGSTVSYQDIYIQFKLHYSAGYDWSGDNNKQMIIGTDDGIRHANICCNPWVAHYITLYAGGTGSNGYFAVEGNNKRSTSGQWFDLSPNTNGYSNDNRYRITSDRWYIIEVRRRLNDAGQTNGIFEMWIDGVKVSEYTQVTYRVPISGEIGSDFSYGTNFVMLSTYINNPAPQNQQMSYDDIILSSSYIGLDVNSIETDHTENTGFNLENNYPNPFNPHTKIGYVLPYAAHVLLEIFDVTGKKVATIVDGSKNAGHHQEKISLNNLASGLYTYRLTAGKFQQVKKMIYLR